MSRHVDMRTLGLEDVSRLVDWAAHEGWNPSPHDAEAFFEADRQGFLGCFVDGELASGIAAVSYGETFGFIGLYITHPKFRGQGFGLKVWNAAMTHLAGRTIGLDGVPAQQSNYMRMGFRKAYDSRRWSGKCTWHAPATNGRVSILPDFSEIGPFDRDFFPTARPAFLRKWIAPPRYAFIARGDKGVRGYVVIRACIEGFKIGPLFACDEETALALLRSCGTVSNGAVVHIDVPETQTSFAFQLEKLGFQPGFETARMYLGTPPQLDMRGIFGITTLELG